MLRSKNQAGFTLIEVIMTLAIAGLLIPIVFTGQKEMRARQEFSGAIERIKNTLVGVKNEAFTTVNESGEDAGKDTENFVFGKFVLFDDFNNQLQIGTIVRNDNDSLLAENVHFSPLPPGLKYDGTPRAGIQGDCVVFTRNPQNGLLETYIVEGIPTQLSSYTPAARNAIDKKFWFLDDFDHEGYVEVNAKEAFIKTATTK